MEEAPKDFRMRRRFHSGLVGLTVAWVAMSAVAGFTFGIAHAAEGNRPGLIGVQYGTRDLRKWQRAMLLMTLDQSWSKADDYGHEWSAKWSGFVRAPATGEITFHAETDKSIDLKVAGKMILGIDPGEKRKSGSVLMEKGRLYPIEVSFYNARGFDAYLKLTWSWDRQEEMPVPPKNLSHSVEQEHAVGWVSGAPDPSQPPAPRS